MQRSFIYSIIVLQFLILSFSNVFAITVREMIEQTESCLKLKENDFKDQDAISRFTNLYLNSLLDYIVNNNKDLIKEKGLENRKFCVLFTDNNIRTSSQGFGLITYQFKHLILSFEEYDAEIATLLSHELAHDILNHFTSGNEVVATIYKEYLKTNNLIDDDNTRFSKEFENHYKNHPDFIRQTKEQEIEADNLGLILYLNAGFLPEKYESFFLKATNEIVYSRLFKENQAETIFSSLSYKDFLLFKQISTVEGCLSLGNDAIKNNVFDQFMNTIKYLPIFTDDHPTGCFRLWNTRKQLSLYDKDSLKNNTVLNSIFLKLDLSEYENLDNLIEYVLEKDNKKLTGTLKDILKDIISNPFSNINYTVDLNSKKESFNINDNTWNVKFYKYLIKPLLKAKYEFIHKKNKKT